MPMRPASWWKKGQPREAPGKVRRAVKNLLVQHRREETRSSSQEIKLLSRSSTEVKAFDVIMLCVGLYSVERTGQCLGVPVPDHGASSIMPFLFRTVTSALRQMILEQMTEKPALKVKTIITHLVAPDIKKKMCVLCGRSGCKSMNVSAYRAGVVHKVPLTL